MKKLLDHIRQGSLFLSHNRGKLASINKTTILPGSLNFDCQIREIVSEGLKNSPLSRHQVAAEMSALLGKEVAKSTLDAFSAESRGNHRLPACYVPAFSVVTGDMTVLSALCAAVGGAFLPEAKSLSLELDRIRGERRELKEREQLIRQLLAALEKDKR